MAIHVHESELLAKNPLGGILIGAEQGVSGGFRMGIAIQERETYGTMGTHDDHEGFYVLEGSGTAKIGDEEFEIRPGSAFIALKGVPHIIKRSPGSKPVKLLCIHGAA